MRSDNKFTVAILAAGMLLGFAAPAAAPLTRTLRLVEATEQEQKSPQQRSPETNRG